MEIWSRSPFYDPEPDPERHDPARRAARMAALVAVVRDVIGPWPSADDADRVARALQLKN